MFVFVVSFQKVMLPLLKRLANYFVALIFFLLHLTGEKGGGLGICVLLGGFVGREGIQ